MWRLTFLGVLVLTVSGLSSVRGAADRSPAAAQQGAVQQTPSMFAATADPRTTGKPNRRTDEIVGYVIDLTKPDWIVLANEAGVAVDKRTSYAFQTPEGTRKASPSDIRVGSRVRITLGQNRVATRVLIVPAR